MPATGGDVPHAGCLPTLKGMNMKREFEGKIAMVTGAGSGIGAEIEADRRAGPVDGLLPLHLVEQRARAHSRRWR